MASITININNCGCCGGDSGSGSSGGSSSGGGASGSFNDLGDPTSTSGPPDGYSDPGLSINDRQCKMAVWLYDWLHWSLDTLANTTTGSAILALYKVSDGLPFANVLRPALLAVVTTIISALTTGPDPSEAVVAIVTYAVTASIIAAWAGIDTAYFTQPAFQAVIAPIEAAKDDLICALSKATSGSDAKDRLAAAVDNVPGLDSSEELLISGLIPDMFYTMLFYTATWWPSFDTDYLSTITTTCCGDYTDGDPVANGSIQQCQASHYIIDQLITLFNTTGEAINTFPFSLNPFGYDKGDLYDRLNENLIIEKKVKPLIEYTAYLKNISEILYYQYWIIAVITTFDPAFSGLATHLTNNKTTLLADLQAAPDQNTAVAVLYTSLSTWIDANVATEYQDWVKQAVSALITVGLIDLLFTQDSELLNYALGECTPTCSNREVKGILVSDNGSTITIDSNGVNATDTRFNVDQGLVSCGNTVTISNYTVVSGAVTVTAGGVAAYRIYNNAGNTIYSSESPPLGTLANVRRILIGGTSATQFVHSFDYIED